MDRENAKKEGSIQILNWIAMIGFVLTFEAFKRIDGYLAFMMFNFSVLITFVIEVFAIHSVSPTMLLLLSAFLIVSASVIAELVNSRCERRGL